MEMSTPLSPEMAQFIVHDVTHESPDKQSGPVPKSAGSKLQTPEEEVERGSVPKPETPAKFQHQKRASILQEGVRNSPNHLRLSEAREFPNMLDMAFWTGQSQGRATVFISPSKKGRPSLLGTVEQPNPFQARLDNFASVAEEDLLETDEGVEEDGRPMPGMIRP